jgi:murein DD-endopeptidase MepM/ murein hydrolase activator NlpD
MKTRQQKVKNVLTLRKCSWKKLMKRVNDYVIIIGCIMLTFVNVSQVSANSQIDQDVANPIAQDYENELDIEIEKILQAIDTAIENSKALYVFIFDIKPGNITISGDYALANIYFYDKHTGEIVPTEAGYSLVYRLDGRWIAIFPDDSDWNSQILQAPIDLISDNMRDYLTISPMVDSPTQISAYGGYYLPWECGLTRTLSRSISHGIGDSYYAFDFYSTSDPYYNVTAARSGVVWYARWDVPRGAGDCGDNINYVNYVVVKNDIGLYDLYLHLDYNSIPSHLRVRGSPVVRGEKVGNADTTGCSTGSHLHFMAHTTSTSYWGTSVDITFQDVNVCDGRPRTPGEAPTCGISTYISGNCIDSVPPVSNISLSGSIGENGWYRSSVVTTLTATDNSSGVSYIQYNLNGTGWVTYTAPFTIYADGFHILQYRSVDNAGNWEVAKSVTVKIDTVAPAGFIQIMHGWATTYQTSVSMETVAGDSTSGVALYRLRDAGGVWSEWMPFSMTSYWLLTALTGQPHTVEAQYNDNAGNISPIYSDSIYLDIYPGRPASQNYQLSKSTFGMSATNAQSTNFQLKGTLAQESATGYSVSDHYQVTSGFWSRIFSLFEFLRNFLPLITK